MSKSQNEVETTHTLPSLQSTLGAATLDEALELMDGHDRTALVQEGSTVATPRISKDAARMCGEAFDFLSHATDEQLSHLPAFSRDWLRVAVGCVCEGDRRYNAFAGASDAETTRQTTAVAAASRLQSDAEAKRGQLHVALVAIAAGDPALVNALSGAYGSAADIPAAIAAQTALVRAWRASGTKTVKARLKKSRLSDEWLAAADAIADQARTANQAASATRTKGSVTQADVDLVDGVNLQLLRSLAAQFEAGHAGDPTIPRITFNALRTHVHRSHHAASVVPVAGASSEAT